MNRTVARLVLCSLRKIPNQRLEVALWDHKASHNGQVYYWPFTTFVDHNTNLPCDVFVHIVAPVSCPADAAAKGVELKRIIKGSAL